MNYFYYVIDNKNKDDKWIAQAVRISGNSNLLSEIKKFPDAIIIHQCKTFKDAQEIAHFWNELHKENNNYLFQ